MSDLSQQLQSYGDQLEAMVEPPEYRSWEPKRSGPPWQAVLGIAASIILVGVTLVWVSQRSDDNTQPLEVVAEVPTVPTGPTSTAQAADAFGPDPQRTAESLVTPTVEPIVDGWERLPVWSSGVAGIVRTSQFEPSFSFVAPDGTRTGCAETVSVVDVVPATEDAAAGTASKLKIMQFGGVSMRDVFAFLSGSAGSFTLPDPATVGEAPGLTFDATGPAAETAPLWIDPNDASCSIRWGDGQQWRFWVLDVDAEAIVIALHASADRFGQAVRLLQPVVDTISWRDFDPSTASRNGPVSLPKPGAPVRQGAYFSEQLGTSVLVTVPDGLKIQRNELGYVAFTTPGSLNVSDRDIVFHRVSELVDPTNVDMSLTAMDPTRIDEWLESPPQWLEVSAAPNRDVGGYPARVFDIQFRAGSECISSEAACWAFTNSDSIVWLANVFDGISYRVYWVDQGAQDPIVILIATPPQAGEWFEDALALVDTIEFGAIEPNPQQDDS